MKIRSLENRNELILMLIIFVLLFGMLIIALTGHKLEKRYNDLVVKYNKCVQPYLQEEVTTKKIYEIDEKLKEIIKNSEDEGLSEK